MDFLDIINKYNRQLQKADFEFIQTPRLGWIAVFTDFKNNVPAVEQFETPNDMETFIQEWISLNNI